MEKMKVLHSKARLSSDGATAMLFNMAMELKDEVQFDFLLYREEGNDWAWKFEELGSEIYYREAKRKNSIGQRLERVQLYSRFFKENAYTTVHVNTDSVERVDVLFCARLHGVKKRIYHAHNSQAEGEGRFVQFPGVRKLLKYFVAHFSTDLLACSTEAAKWMFPERHWSEVKLIKNGIDTEKFRYDQTDRVRVRDWYGLKNNLLIGCVARFAEQKNHEFLIDVFAEVVKTKENARLLLIGDGDLKETIQKKVKALQLGDQVIFVGTTDKVEEYLSAMDIYVMPSLFEGLSLTFLEAQTAGLYCFASTNISVENQVCERMEFISLEEKPAVWKDRILSDKVQVTPSVRSEAWKTVVAAGYDIRDASRELLAIYKR